MKSSRIIGTGSYAPEKILTNEELSKLVDTSDEWITSRTGIKQRHIAREGEQTSDMAAEASKKLLKAGLTASDLDMIIVGTISGDMPMPACAAFVQPNSVRNVRFDVSAHGGSLFVSIVTNSLGQVQPKMF